MQTFPKSLNSLKAITISHTGELTAKLTEALAVTDRPVVIDAQVVRADNVYPMIPPGASYDKMVLGPSAEALDKPTGST